MLNMYRQYVGMQSHSCCKGSNVLNFNSQLVDKEMMESRQSLP